MRSLREPTGATTAGVNLLGSGFALALGAGADASDVGTEVVTPKGVYGLSFSQP